MTLLTTADMAARWGVSREYATDRIVTRPDFPAPALVFSRKTRRWALADVEAWEARQAARAGARQQTRRAA